jgi:hypothetical protein
MNKGMEFFFNWMAKPLNPEDVDAWFRANNIIPEYSELFKDFCFSLLFLIKDTYLGDSHGDSKETKIGLTSEEKKQHFEWCWNTTLKNFEKENILFEFKQDDYDYFESFFFEVFYEQTDFKVRGAIQDFIGQLFTRNRAFAKSDLEMFTDVYKVLERSLVN